MADDISSQPGGSGESVPTGPSQDRDRHAPNYEPSQDERTVVAQWLKRADLAKKRPVMKEWEEQLETHRGYVAGTVHKDKTDSKVVRTNMVYATIAAQMPELYAKNPTITCKPTDAVPAAKMGMVKKFGATAEKVIRKMLVEEGQLKKRAKANIRSTCSTSFGVLKITYQKEYRGDSVIIRRINDTQDNLARVEGLIKSLRKIEDVELQARKRDELHANLTALSGAKEVKMFKGFAIDRVKSEDFMILDEGITEFDEYLEAQALGQEIWMRVGDARDLFMMDPVAATRYNAPRVTDDKASADKIEDDDKFICVVEIWDKKNGVIRTTARGMNRWLREPYAPPHTGQRWYPFFVLGFNLIEGRWRPISDVELLMGLQDEYNDTRTNYADHRKHIVPILIFRKAGGLSEPDIEKITNRKNKDTIGVEGNPSVPLTQDLMWLEGAKIDPQAYDVTLIRNDMDLVTGRSDASRANLIKPKTATEAEIMAEAMQSRMGERRDTHEDLMSEMGEFALEICLDDLTKDEVMQVAGEDAVWPEVPQTADDIAAMVTVKVRAGSSGRPNIQKEREQWMMLMPIIKETMLGVAELRANGALMEAEGTLELLRETLARFEENLDLDAIIPPMEEGGPQQMLQQMAQELQGLKEQLAMAQEELAKSQESEAKAKQAEQAKMIEAQTKDTLALSEDARKQASFENDQRRADEQAKRDQDRADADAEHKRKLSEDEMGLKQRLAGEESAAGIRQGDQKLENERELNMRREDIKLETGTADREANERYKAEAAAADQKFQQVLKVLADAIDALRGATEELAEVSGADRVPEYGEDGMPTRLRVERKPKDKKKETVQ